MADDELVSYWDIVHPPLPTPEPVFGLDDLSDAPEPDPPKRPAFCYECGLPSRICDGSDHLKVRNARRTYGWNILRWQTEESDIFWRKARHLTEEETVDIQHRLTWIRQASNETNEQFFRRRRALNEVGKIVVSRWRIDLFRRIFHER